MPDSLQGIIALLLTLSFASERLVTIVKTFVPWLSEEHKTPAKEVDVLRDRPRRLAVQGIALLSSWVSTGVMVGDFSPLATVPVGAGIPLVLVAVLASGGSALWSSVLGYTKALKDTKLVEKASSNLEFRTQAERLGVDAIDGGVTASGPPAKSEAKALEVLATLRSRAVPPSFDAVRKLPGEPR